MPATEDTPAPFSSPTAPSRYCRRCLYELHGLPQPRCPECGRAFDPDNPASVYTSKRQHTSDKLKRVLLYMLGLWIPEFFCAVLAYETVGEVCSKMLILLMVAGNIVVALSLLARVPLLSWALLLFLVLLIVPRQLYLAARLVMLQSEAERLVAYVQEYKRGSGSYPPDLSGYRFHFEINRKHVQRYVVTPTGEFGLFWYIGTPGTSHRYVSDQGWGYYPD